MEIIRIKILLFGSTFVMIFQKAGDAVFDFADHMILARRHGEIITRDVISASAFTEKSAAFEFGANTAQSVALQQW